MLLNVPYARLLKSTPLKENYRVDDIVFAHAARLSSLVQLPPHFVIDVFDLETAVWVPVVCCALQ